jgi:hypothetical protein
VLKNPSLRRSDCLERLSCNGAKKLTAYSQATRDRETLHDAPEFHGCDGLQAEDDNQHNHTSGASFTLAQIKNPGWRASPPTGILLLFRFEIMDCGAVYRQQSHFEIELYTSN